MEELKDKNILILGSQGMAGHILTSYFRSKNYRVTGVARKIYKEFGNEEVLDVSQFQTLKTFLENRKFDVVINAVGVLIGDSKADNKRAYELNGILPQLLHQWSEEYSYKLILISTDCVFDGKVGLYSENDTPNAKDAYGLSKRIGEVQDETGNTLTIRTSIIGPELKEGTGLWQWFQKQQGVIYGYSKVFWSGVTTLELAKFIEHALLKDLQGLKQLSNGSPISKYVLLRLFQENGLNENVEIKEKNEPYSNKTLLHSQLDGYKVSTYAQMINELVQFQIG